MPNSIAYTESQVDAMCDGKLILEVAKKYNPENSEDMEWLNSYLKTFDPLNSVEDALQVAVANRMILELPYIAKVNQGDPRIKSNWVVSKSDDIKRSICKAFLMMKS